MSVEDTGEATSELPPTPQRKRKRLRSPTLDPDVAPETGEHLTAAEGSDDLDEALEREEPEEGNEPGTAVEAIAEDEAPEEAADADGDSLESIVKDLKRERGQS